MGAWVRYAAVAINVLFVVLARGVEPFFAMMSGFCADGGADRSQAAMWTCMGVVMTLPLLLTVPFAIVSVILLLYGRAQIAFLVACGPPVEAVAAAWWIHAQ
jgi:hypothetical protein